jgi:hypothetical protein
MHHKFPLCKFLKLGAPKVSIPHASENKAEELTNADLNLVLTRGVNANYLTPHWG